MNESMQSPLQPEPVKLWKTKKEIATHFSCHVRTITNFMRRRILPYTKIGRFVRFDQDACDQAMTRFTRHCRF